MQDTKKRSKNRQLLSEISQLSEPQKKVFYYIFNSCLYYGGGLEFYRELSSKEHFTKNLGATYYRHLKVLVQKDLIQVNHSYSAFKDKPKFAKSYRINPRLLGSAIRVKDTKKKPSKRISDRMLDATKKQLQQMKCNLSASEIKRIVHNYIDNKFINSRFKPLHQTDIEGLFSYYLFKNGEIIPFKAKLPRKKLIALASKNGLDALYCKSKNNVILGDASEIKELRKQALRTAYIEILTDFATGNQYTFLDRSNTNGRLTTPFTVFPSKLLKYLKFYGDDFVQHDISNSQFCILSNLILAFDSHLKTGAFYGILERLRRTAYFDIFKDCLGILHDDSGEFKDDAKEFFQLSISGELYEPQKWTQTRDEVKKTMFIVAFASHRYNPEAKKLLKERFQSVITFIDEMKKRIAALKIDKCHFAVMLQEIESYICIDNVLYSLQRVGVPTLTRHDSFCCPKKYADLKIRRIKIESELDRLLPFGYSLKSKMNYDE